MPAGIGVTGLILIIVVALLLFGPNKLPELGRAFGRTLREFKAGAREIMDDEPAQQKAQDQAQVQQAQVQQPVQAQAQPIAQQQDRVQAEQASNQGQQAVQAQPEQSQQAQAQPTRTADNLRLPE